MSNKLQQWHRAMTLDRFSKYSENEERVWNRFLDSYDRKEGFEGIKREFSDYDVHPEGEQDYDIRVNNLRIRITVDIQESQNFDTYGDLRLDYVSAYTPNLKYRTLHDFERAIRKGAVNVDKWGKVVEPKADYLVVEFQRRNRELFFPDPHRVYSLSLLHKHLSYWRSLNSFFTNNKTQGEPWGSAFIPVKRDNATLRSTEPQSLRELTTPILRWQRPSHGEWER